VSLFGMPLLVKQRDVRDWLWLAFLAVEGAIRNEIQPAASLRDSLAREIEREPDPRRKTEMKSVLGLSGA
jgi:hypothetical protein